MYFMHTELLLKKHGMFKHKSPNDMEETTKTIGFCVKCKAKQEMKDVEIVEMHAKGGKKRPAAKGTCVTCGTKMFKILSSKPPAEV